jgi:hypothetical protein
MSVIPITFRIIKDSNEYVISTLIYIGQKNINFTNSNLFSLSSSSLSIGGKEVLANGNWAGNAATAITADKLSTNAGGVL